MALYRKKEKFEAIVLQGIKNVKEVAEMLSNSKKGVSFSFSDGKIVLCDETGEIMKEGDVLVGENIINKEDFDSNYEKVITRTRKSK